MKKKFHGLKNKSCIFFLVLLYFKKNRIKKGDMAELVDATDLKSVDFYDREGSSPSIPKFSRLQFLYINL